jgi:hypothetical protein
LFSVNLLFKIEVNNSAKIFSPKQSNMKLYIQLLDSQIYLCSIRSSISLKIAFSLITIIFIRVICECAFIDNSISQRYLCSNLLDTCNKNLFFLLNCQFLSSFEWELHCVVRTVGKYCVRPWMLAMYLSDLAIRKYKKKSIVKGVDLITSMV